MNAEPTDPYFRQAIANYIQLPVQVIAGSMTKILIILGDRFAITCTMVVRDEEMRNPRVVERICQAILFIFANAARFGLAECPGDRYPIYSIFLLEKLRDGVTDEASRALIDKTLDLLNHGVVEGSG